MILEDLKYKQKLFIDDGLQYSLFRVCTTDGTSAMVLYRLMRWFQSHGLSPLAYVTQVINKWMNQCVIGTRTDFGSKFVIMHPVGIVMNSSVRGGEAVVLESCVTIGSEKGQSPELGNYIFVGSGAKIIGGVKVGDNAKIGANAVVVNDVSADTTVVGIPAKPIVRRNAQS